MLSKCRWKYCWQRWIENRFWCFYEMGEWGKCYQFFPPSFSDALFFTFLLVYWISYGASWAANDESTIILFIICSSKYSVSLCFFKGWLTYCSIVYLNMVLFSMYFSLFLVLVLKGKQNHLRRYTFTPALSSHWILVEFARIFVGLSVPNRFFYESCGKVPILVNGLVIFSLCT